MSRFKPVTLVISTMVLLGLLLASSINSILAVTVATIVWIVANFIVGRWLGYSGHYLRRVFWSQFKLTFGWSLCVYVVFGLLSLLTNMSALEGSFDDDPVYAVGLLVGFVNLVVNVIVYAVQYNQRHKEGSHE